MAVGILFVLAAFAVVIGLVIVATGAVVGASLGAAIGGALPWMGRSPIDKGSVAAGVSGRILRGTLGILGGGLLGGVAGAILGVLLIWALLAAG